MQALGREVPELWYEVPAYYKGLPDTVIGPEDEIPWPRYSGKLDYELEIACVIGAEGSDIAAADARSHIFGWTIWNDLSARDTQARELPLGMGPVQGQGLGRLEHPRPLHRHRRRARRLRRRDDPARQRRGAHARPLLGDAPLVRRPDRLRLAQDTVLRARRGDRLGHRPGRRGPRERALPAGRRRDRDGGPRHRGPAQPRRRASRPDHHNPSTRGAPHGIRRRSEVDREARRDRRGGALRRHDDPALARRAGTTSSTSRTAIPRIRRSSTSTSSTSTRPPTRPTSSSPHFQEIGFGDAIPRLSARERTFYTTIHDPS